MQNTGSVSVNGKKLQSYQQSQIMGMEPVPLLIKVYDFTILSCKRKDIVRASKGLVELISALNFDQVEIALGLFRLYQYCQDKIKKNEFDEAIAILQNLRNTWIESIQQD